MAFGIETDFGWWKTIEEYFDKIQDLLDSGTEEQLSPFEVLQVKEKYATLRVYYYGGNDAIEALVEELEDACDNTCETCGKSPAKVYESHMWYKTLCEECGNSYLTR
jgi:hypothetical protein